MSSPAHGAHATGGAFTPELACGGESSIDALQRFEAECGWSDALRVLAELTPSASAVSDGHAGE